MQDIDLQTQVTHGAIIDNRYQILELIHPGYNEILTKAIDKTLDNEVIFLKIFHITSDTSKDDLERFEREVVISRKLSHPNIAPVFDIGKYDSCYRYISLAAAKGTDLETHQNNNKGKISFNIALDIVYRLCNALNHAHENGILHRSINPSNIYVEIENDQLKNLKILNFGFGKLIGSNLSLTKTGEIVGLSPYTAPEQIRGEILDQRADLYSIGILAYELLSGEKASLQSQEPCILKAMTLGDSLPSLSTLNKDTPKWVEDLVNKATASDKTKRFNTAKEMRDFILSHSCPQNNLSDKSSNFIKKIKSLLTKKHLAIVFLSLIVTCLLFLSISSIVNSKKDLPEFEMESSKKIFSAIINQNEPEVYRLLKEGVNPHLRDSTQTPILITAVKTEQANIAYTILSKKAETISDVDLEGKTALIHAVISKNLELVKLLINFNADPSFKDMKNKSAMDYAEEQNNEMIKNLLLKKK